MWLDEISPQLNVLWQGRWSPGTVEPGRYLSDHEFVAVKKGTCTVEMDNRMWRLKPGQFLIIPPATYHVTTGGPSAIYRWCIHFDWIREKRTIPPRFLFYPERLPQEGVRTAPDFIPMKYCAGSFPLSGPIPRLLETTFQRWTSRSHSERMAARASFLELLMRVRWPQNDKIISNRSEQLAYSMTELISRDGQKSASIRSLLKTLGFSYPHLCRVFHAAFGLTPIEYRNRLRLERAKILLKDPLRSVSEIAYGVGFDDPGYFIRLFKRQNGTSPGKYRLSPQP